MGDIIIFQFFLAVHFMKTTLALLVVVAFLLRESSAQTYFPDLPAGGNRPPSFVKFAAGSLVIDMGDKQIENTSINATSVAGLFNLYAYGTFFSFFKNKLSSTWIYVSSLSKALRSACFMPTFPCTGLSRQTKRRMQWISRLCHRGYYRCFVLLAFSVLSPI